MNKKNRYPLLHWESYGDSSIDTRISSRRLKYLNLYRDEGFSSADFEDCDNKEYSGLNAYNHKFNSDRNFQEWDYMIYEYPIDYNDDWYDVEDFNIRELLGLNED